MKKILIMILTLVISVSLVACGGTGSGSAAGGSASSSADLSAYPADLNEWTAQNFVDYFKSTGLFKDGNGFETWTQDHATYYPGTAIHEVAGYWDDAELEACYIFILSGDDPDSSEEMLNECLENIKTKKQIEFGEGIPPFTVDHLVGNVAFVYTDICTDEEAIKNIEDQYNAFVEKMGLTPEF